MARPTLWSKVFAFGFAGGMGAFVGSLVGAGLYYGTGSLEDQETRILKNSIWEALVCIGLILLLILFQNWYLQRRVTLSHQNLLTIAGAGLLGLVCGSIWTSSLSSIQASDLVNFIILAIIILGGLGMGMGFLSTLLAPNLSRLPLVLAGTLLWPSIAIGSFVARPEPDVSFYWVLFDALKGIGLGIFMPMVESLTAKSWLQLEEGVQAPRVVNLGKQPLGITVDGKVCLASEQAPNLVLRYRLEQGQVICDDFLSQATTPAEIGKQRIVADTRITVWGDSAVPGLTPQNQLTVPGQVPPLAESESQPRSEYTLRLSDGSSLALTLGVCLSESELRGLESAHDDQRTVAEVNCHPQHPELLGLKNHSLQTWQLTLPAEDPRPIEPGRSARLTVGNQIKFVDFMEGEVTI
jgi:hypothetical protein